MSDDAALVQQQAAEETSPGLVNTRAFDVFWAFLQSRGVAKETVVDAIVRDEDIPRADLVTAHKWVDYRVLCAVEQQVAAALPDEPDLFRAIGRSIGKSGGLGFLGNTSRAMLGPALVYGAIPGMMRRFLFAFFQASYHQVEPGVLRGNYHFQPGCPPTQAFLETAAGVLSSVPAMLGAPPADVQIERVAPLSVVITVRVEQWPGALGRLRELWRRIRLRFASRQEMIEGLLATHDELQQRVAELESLRAGLALQVAERTAALEAAKSDLANNVTQLEAASSAQNRFFTNVSHEFKTPLTLMLSAVEELERGERSPKQAAAALRRHAGSLLGLINELLDFARIDSDRMPLRPSRFDLADVLSATLNDIEPLASARSLTMRQHWPEERLPVELDRTLVTRAVLNLVVNAIKYIRPGDTIEVRARAVGEDRVAIEVIDTGPGIAAEEQAKIAERFGRAVDADGRAIEGSGIGLAMVHEIAALHGGGLQLESAAGAGATFRLDLPRVVTSPDAEAGLAVAPDADAAQVAAFVDAAQSALIPLHAAGEPDLGEAPPTSRAHPARILVVDDNEELRAWMARIVGREHVVESAVDGQAALELARSWRPDVIVSDVMMPRLDGFGLVRALRTEAELQHVGVILVTARHGREPVLQGFEARCDDFLQKPFAADELLARVDTQVRLRRLQRALIRSGRAQLLSALSAGMAHEVLNPINALLQSVRLLREDQAEPMFEAEMRAELLGAIERGGQRVQRIIGAIQRFARHDAERGERVAFALTERWEELQPLIGHRVPDQAIVEATLQGATLLGYPDLFDQALANLVLNALDAIGPGGRVRVEAERDGADWLVAVDDDGPGVPEERRNAIFEPFVTSKDPGAGTGMGLAIAREIAELHGGSLRLGHSRLGGARFEMRIPRTEPRQ